MYMFNVASAPARPKMGHWAITTPRLELGTTKPIHAVVRYYLLTKPVLSDRPTSSQNAADYFILELQISRLNLGVNTEDRYGVESNSVVWGGRTNTDLDGFSRTKLPNKGGCWPAIGAEINETTLWSF